MIQQLLHLKIDDVGCYPPQSLHPLNTKKTCAVVPSHSEKESYAGPPTIPYIEENANIPLEHTPGIPTPPNGRNSFIKCWLRVWGMFQGYVGKFLEYIFRSNISLFSGKKYIPSWELTYPFPKACLSRWFSFSQGAICMDMLVPSRVCCFLSGARIEVNQWSGFLLIFFVGVRIEFNVSPGGLVVEFLGGFRHLIMIKNHRKPDMTGWRITMFP